jgi:hypothetical protein
LLNEQAFDIAGIVMASDTYPISDTLLNELAQRFAWHAKNIYGVASINSSPLYAQLSLEIVRDPAILSLAAKADLSQQVSNLFLGAVHFLLLSGTASPLAEYYPSLSLHPRPRQEAYPYFRAFCLEHADAIKQLVATQRVQTNEVGRCSALLPAFGLVAERAGGRPLTLVEIGPSAGLHMLWDQYGYDYGQAGYAGNRESSVQLFCTPQGKVRPPLPDALPKVADRVGIDLAPIDVGDEPAIRWLRALIWPEHNNRARLLERAIQIARQNPPTLLAGNAAEILPQILRSIPPEPMICVYHSYTLNQCAALVREKILDGLKEFAQEKDLFRISLEWYSGQHQPHLELFSYEAGTVKSELLAYCESHGRSMEWLQS